VLFICRVGVVQARCLYRCVVYMQGWCSPGQVFVQVCCLYAGLVWFRPGVCTGVLFICRVGVVQARCLYRCGVYMQGWFSPGQVFVLDEYCARYGVRGCKRHLSYLYDLLNSAERGTMIDPTLMHYSFAFCASHVHGHRCTERVDYTIRYDTIR